MNEAKNAVAKNVTTKELAAWIGVHRATLLTWINRGLVPPGREVGNAVVWSPSAAAQIVRRVAQVRMRVDELMPQIRRDECGWICPACYRVFEDAHAAVAVRSHLVLCPLVWGPEPRRVRVPAAADLLAIAWEVITRRAEPEAFMTAVRVQRARIVQIEAELHELQGVQP